MQGTFDGYKGFGRIHERHDRLDGEEPQEVKKAGTPHLSYLIHLYAHYEVLAPHEQETYDDLLSI